MRTFTYGLVFLFIVGLSACSSESGQLAGSDESVQSHATEDDSLDVMVYNYDRARIYYTAEVVNRAGQSYVHKLDQSGSVVFTWDLGEEASDALILGFLDNQPLVAKEMVIEGNTSWRMYHGEQEHGRNMPTNIPGPDRLTYRVNGLSVLYVHDTHPEDSTHDPVFHLPFASYFKFEARQPAPWIIHWGEELSEDEPSREVECQEMFVSRGMDPKGYSWGFFITCNGKHTPDLERVTVLPHEEL